MVKTSLRACLRVLCGGESCHAFAIAPARGLAQDVKDVRAVLQAAMKAMGGANLKTIEYSGAGWFSRIGQTYGLTEDWPQYEVTDYTRAIDYDAKWSREDYTRRQGNYPTLGRAPMAAAARHGDPERHVRLGHAERHARAAHAPVSRRRRLLRSATARARAHAARRAQGGAGRHRRHGHHAAHRRRIGLRPLAVWPQGDDRLVQPARQVQDERDDQRSESRRARRTPGFPTRSTATWTTRCATRSTRTSAASSFPRSSTCTRAIRG